MARDVPKELVVRGKRYWESGLFNRKDTADQLARNYRGVGHKAFVRKDTLNGKKIYAVYLRRIGASR